MKRDAHGLAIEQATVERIEHVWREAGHDIWARRASRDSYGYWHVMAWVALERFLRNKVSASQPIKIGSTG